MKKNFKFITSILIVLCITLTIAIMPTEKEGAIYQDTVRLHILANSNSDEDQALKLIIRDKLLEKYGGLLASSSSTEEAISNLAELCAQMEKDVNAWIKENGKSYTCNIELGEEWYETREYENFTLPCGYYTSLQVMLGDAEGKNWWCVMYPPLCTELATAKAPGDDAVVNYTKEETKLITKKGYNVKFKMLEIISETFS